MGWVTIAASALKLATYYFNPKERKRRRKLTFLKKINNLRTKQLKSRRLGDEVLWNRLDIKIQKLIEEAKKLND